jgi:alkanesulfonate monooxygenase SsuD/methylene tetrahydromethanopterin reductase-like flavin-dependent oxidoreductase (luciferase family)
MVTLSAAAAVTERVKIVFDAAVPPLHHEVILAKQVASLDVVSEGRVVFGVGAGGREEDFRATGASFDGRLDRLEEQIAVMRRIWAGERVVEGALRPVEPLPRQPGGPEVLAGSLFPRSIRRAARWADGLCGFSFGPSPDEIGRSFELAREAWKIEGRSEPRLVTGFWFALGDMARDRLDAYLGRYLNFMGPRVAEKLAPTVQTTSAAGLRAAARQIADLGADEILLVPTTLDPDEVDRVADALG